MAVAYFFDSYAVIELVTGNPDYARYQHESVAITIFNLAEIYWSALHKLPPASAEEVYDTYKDAVTDIDDDTLKEAIAFRKAHKKKRLSYTDWIGYVFARRHGMLFLTGDKEFKGMPNVEFVK